MNPMCYKACVIAAVVSSLIRREQVALLSSPRVYPPPTRPFLGPFWAGPIRTPSNRLGRFSRSFRRTNEIDEIDPIVRLFLFLAITSHLFCTNKHTRCRKMKLDPSKSDAICEKGPKKRGSGRNTHDMKLDRSKSDSICEKGPKKRGKLKL